MRSMFLVTEVVLLTSNQLDGHEFEQAPGVGDGQGSLVCLRTMGLQRVGHD